MSDANIFKRDAMNRILAVTILFSSFFAGILCALPQGEMASQDSAQASPEAPPRRAKMPRGLPRGASLAFAILNSRIAYLIVN